MNCFRCKGLRSRTTICQFFYHPFTEKVQVISSISELFIQLRRLQDLRKTQNTPVCLNEITCRFNRQLYSST